MRPMLFRLLLLTGAALLAACGAPPPAPTDTPTLVPSNTPPPPVATGRYDDLPAGRLPDGFPTLGDPAAPVTLVLYNSYDSNASARAHNEIIVLLLPRVRAGELRIVLVPLSGTGSVANGADAARAALCAGEQSAYWRYHDLLFTRLGVQGGNAYTGNALLDLADAAGLDRDAFNACTLSDRPDAVLEDAAGAALNEENYAGTPTILVNGNYMLNEFVSINRVVDQMMARVDAETGVVGTMATPVYENPEDVPERIEISPMTSQQLDTPITLELPAGWGISLSDTMVVQDIDALRTVPFTLYKGPLVGGATGNIVMLWAFPSLVAGNPFAAELGGAPTPQVNLLTDGLRLLRLAIVEPGCNVGTDMQRQYTLADGRTGTGTAWSAVDCPDLPDTRGWFVGLQEQGLNFLFFAYIEPINPAGVTPEEQAGREQLQAVLSSIRFRDLSELEPPATTTPEGTE